MAANTDAACALNDDARASLDEARAFIRNADFVAAERCLSRTLDNAAGEADPDSLYTLAVAQRYQGKLDYALQTLAELLRRHPDYSRAYQEQGHVLLTNNRLTEAEHAYEAAVHRNPALVASWRALINLYELREASDPHELRPRIEHASAQLEFFSSLPKALASAYSYLFDGRLEKADTLCRHYLRQHKLDVRGMRLLARIGEAFGVLPDAEFLLETALELQPDDLALRYDYANLLLRMQKFEAAHAATERLVAADAASLPFAALHANALAGLGRYDEAIARYDQVLAQSARQPAVFVMRGHAQKTVGRIDEAIASYREAARRQSDYGDAYWSLANTKSYRFDDGEIATMLAKLSTPLTGDEDRIHLGFALGKAYEDRGAFEQSWACYRDANALKRTTLKHRAEYLEHRADRIERCFSAALFERHDGAGCPARDPIFIVGLPRAGSTLVEQILASHPDIDGTHELATVPALVQRLRRRAVDAGAPRYPDSLATLDAAVLRDFGAEVIAAAEVYRDGAALFIDKNPNNFFHVGLIRLILPNAKIIDARRHPMACCFSGFKQLFAQGQEFSYDLADIGDYYRQYVRIMAHWDEVLPGYVHRVQHERVVDDLEREVRALLDFAGVDFDQRCLDFHRTERRVRTPSSEQVRQPIYRTALEQWRHYERWLDPLKHGLGESLCRQYQIEYP